VELLVVIAIIGILVALLLPAIQAAREAARRATCVNQLRQMSLAMQNHVSAYGVFPTGGSRFNPNIKDYVTGNTANPGVPNGPAKQGLGWAYQILPYLEQGAIKGIVTQAQLQNAVVSMYLCPSRRSPDVVRTDPGTGSPTTVLSDYASAQPMTTSCVGTTGDSGVKIDLTKTHPFVGATSYAIGRTSFWCTTPAAAGGSQAGDPHSSNSVYDGVIVRSQYRVKTGANATSPAVLERLNGGPDPVKASQISDGTSNTLVISEKVVRSDLIAGAITPSGAFSYSDDRGWSDGWDPDTVRSTGFQPISDSDQSICFNPNVNISKYCTGQDADVFFFGSAHPGGVNAAFADASVHQIAFDVDILIFNALGSRNGQETVDLEQL
jgi:prepilin-type processing-associated H-X9-DG protein